MPHIKFNWVDIVFVTLLVRTSYIGFKNGFLPEFFRFLGLLVAFVVSFNNYTLVSHFLSTHTKWAGASPDVISFLFIFLLILFIFKIFSRVSSLALSAEKALGSGKLIGLVIGFTRGIVLISLTYTLFVNSPFNYLSMSAKERSLSSQYISNVAPSVYKIGIIFYPWEKVETPLVELLEK